MAFRHDGNKKFRIRPNSMALGPKNTVFLARKSVFCTLRPYNPLFLASYRPAGCTYLTRFASRVVLQHVFQYVPPFVPLLQAIWGLPGLQWPKVAFLAKNGPFFGHFGTKSGEI